MSGKVKMVTMRDVAQASGFSPATVSIVLNNAPLARYIAPATKKRIEDAAKKLGYRPNAMARFLRSRRACHRLVSIPARAARLHRQEEESQTVAHLLRRAGLRQ